jgi:protein-tyrosine phosphatase
MTTSASSTSFDEVSCIIPGLYLSGISIARNSAKLAELKISNIVCCCTWTEFPESDEVPGLPYLRIDIEDMSREPIELFFDEACDFIAESLENHEGVLVHCRSGVSRSSTIVLSFLVKSMGMRLFDAFFLLRSKRGIVTPNIGFMNKLLDLEQNTLGFKSVSIQRYSLWYTSDSRPAIPDIEERTQPNTE